MNTFFFNWNQSHIGHQWQACVCNICYEIDKQKPVLMQFRLQVTDDIKPQRFFQKAWFTYVYVFLSGRNSS